MFSKKETSHTTFRHKVFVAATCPVSRFHLKFSLRDVENFGLATTDVHKATVRLIHKK